MYVISQDVVAENHDELIWTFRDDENDTIFLENVWYSYETGIVTSETVFVDVPSVILEEEID